MMSAVCCFFLAGGESFCSTENFAEAKYHTLEFLCTQLAVLRGVWFSKFWFAAKNDVFVRLCHFSWRRGVVTLAR